MGSQKENTRKMDAPGDTKSPNHDPQLIPRSGAVYHQILGDFSDEGLYVSNIESFKEEA